MNPTTLSMYAAFGVLSAGALPITATIRAIHGGDPTHRRAGRSLRTLGRAIATASRAWDFGYEGVAPADLEQKPVVVVANHRSLADPFLLSYLPFDMRFVAKEELFRAPLVGWLLKLAGDIPVTRGDHASGREMIDECVATVRRGLSVMIFPEGTRSKDGGLGRFRDGAFHVARATGARILPVALYGTEDCIGRGGPQPARARARILRPIDSVGVDLDTLREQTRVALGEALSGRSYAATTPALRAARATVRSPRAA